MNSKLLYLKGVIKINTNEELVIKSKAGDISSFIELLRLKQDMLYAIAYKYTNNKSDAEDCLSDATIKAFDKVHQLKKNEYFYTWFNSVLINTCRQYNKRNNRSVSYNDELNNIHALYSISKAEDKIFVSEILASLKSRESEILELRYIKEYPFKKIARIIKLPESTVKTIMYRTIKKIRRNNYGRELK
jgi:RNA polymerase sigma-70 factor (ECF subfamily)